MNADAFRHLYGYHFTANRNLWNKSIMRLSDEQFVHTADYSVGSLRNQVVHLMSVDDRWFSALRNVEVPDFLNPADYPLREKIRTEWDAIEANMQEYLATLQDDMLFTQPFVHLNGEPTQLWQVLIHVVNHATDHRAQINVLLDKLGCPTTPQDYMHYIREQH